MPLYCTSFLAVEEDKQQKIARVSGPVPALEGGLVDTPQRAAGQVTPLPPPLGSPQLLQLWEKNGYFDEAIIQQLQSPALGLGQYQVSAGHPPTAQDLGRETLSRPTGSRGLLGRPGLPGKGQGVGSRV